MYLYHTVLVTAIPDVILKINVEWPQFKKKEKELKMMLNNKNG